MTNVLTIEKHNTGEVRTKLWYKWLNLAYDWTEQSTTDLDF